MQFITKYSSPVGVLTIASDGASITGLWMEGQKHFAATLDTETEEYPLPLFDCVFNWLDRYFAGEAPQMTISLAPEGSEFRKKVWKILCEIPYGRLLTYGEIAKQIALQTGKTSMSAQAVGGAVGHNPISILIPCHRVVGSTGNLIGYAGGIEKKIKLLKLEKVDTVTLFMPAKGTAL